MESTSHDHGKEKGQRSLPDGAKLLSIIKRLTGQNGFTVSSGAQGRKAAVVCQENDSLHSHRTRNSHCKPIMARGKPKGFGCSIHDHNENMDLCEVGLNFDVERSTNLPLLEGPKSEKQFSLDDSKANKQSTQPNDLQESHGVKTTGLLLSKNVKFAVKVRRSSEEVTPVMCLCKPPNPVTNSEGYSCCCNMDDSLSDEAINVYEKSKEASCCVDDRLSNETVNTISQKSVKSSCCTGTSSNAFMNNTTASLGEECYKSSCICGICLQQFPTAFFLEKHRRQSKHYLCSGCGRDFDDRALFEKHVLDEECKKQCCSMCKRKFILVRDLGTTKMERHSRCPECQKFFKKAEKSSSQNTTTPHCCTECGKTFHVYSRYKTHMMTSHTGERPFVCPQCGRGFARMYALSTHMKYTHSDEKKFKCDYCPKTFKRKDHLKNHAVTHSSKKPYCCKVCGQGFNQKISLKKHIPCSNTTKLRATETGTNQSITVMDSKNTRPSGTIQRNLTEGYLSCRCPASCECKKVTIALSASCEDSSNEFREVSTLSCCHNIELREDVSKNNV